MDSNRICGLWTLVVLVYDQLLFPPLSKLSSSSDYVLGSNDCLYRFSSYHIIVCLLCIMSLQLGFPGNQKARDNKSAVCEL